VASGVYDNGGPVAAGVATAIICTNFTGATQSIRFLVRNWNATVVASSTFQVQSLRTFTATTHSVAAFFQDTTLSPGASIAQGSLRIFATSGQVTCTAVVIDASTAVPIGIPLHLVRHNPWPGTQE
jgi:hypothetical protein